MTENSKKRYQFKILTARGLLRDGKVVDAYMELGAILEDMEK